MVMSLSGVVQVASCSLEFVGTRGRYCYVQLSGEERGASHRDRSGKAWASNWFKGSNLSCVDTDGWGEHCRGARLDNEMHLFSLLFSSALSLFNCSQFPLAVSLSHPHTIAPSLSRSLSFSADEARLITCCAREDIVQAHRFPSKDWWCAHRAGKQVERLSLSSLCVSFTSSLILAHSTFGSVLNI